MNTPSSRMVTGTPRCSAIGAVAATTRWATSPRLVSSRSSTAAPASNRLISSRSASRCSNRSSSFCSSSADRAVIGSKLRPRVVQHVTGHPHGGQRGAQLVRDVGDEPALHPGELDELADLRLQRLGHLVEGHGETRDVVLAGDVHPFLEAPGGDPLGHPPRQPDRGDHLPRDEQRHPGNEHQEEDAGREQHLPQQHECLLLLLHREEVVERVGARRRTGARPSSRPPPRAAAACALPESPDRR